MFPRIVQAADSALCLFNLRDLLCKVVEGVAQKGRSNKERQILVVVYRAFQQKLLKSKVRKEAVLGKPKNVGDAFFSGAGRDVVGLRVSLVYQLL